VDRVALVREASVARALRLLHREHGIRAEGSAGVGVAAILEGAVHGLAGPVAVVVSGSNIDGTRLAGILEGSD
jgi:threonine dehydratase